MCHLLGIDSAEHLSIHSARGAIFEGFVISEFIKKMKNAGQSKGVYYWRTNSGTEIDFLIDSNPIKIIEIKSGVTFQKSFVDKILDWQLLTEDNAEGMLVYAGDERFVFKNIDIVPWNKI